MALKRFMTPRAHPDQTAVMSRSVPPKHLESCPDAALCAKRFRMGGLGTLPAKAASAAAYLGLSAANGTKLMREIAAVDSARLELLAPAGMGLLQHSYDAQRAAALPGQPGGDGQHAAAAAPAGGGGAAAAEAAGGVMEVLELHHAMRPTDVLDCDALEEAERLVLVRCLGGCWACWRLAGGGGRDVRFAWLSERRAPCMPPCAPSHGPLVPCWRPPKPTSPSTLLSDRPWPRTRA